ncbi:MAG TPA: hypothetical protein VJR89_19040 [Polyangiales bacterium]|nr:hypothetical protein [Polyangiales bacterium]
MSAQRWLALLACSWGLLQTPLVAAGQDDELGEDEELGGEESAAEPPEAEASETVAAEEGAPDAAEEPAAATEPDTGRTLTARAVVGAGVGTRSLRRPIASGASQTLPTSVFPAADISLSARVWPDAAFSLDVLFRYQTSLGLTIQEEPLFALENEVDVRAEHAELSAAPSFRLGESATAARVNVPVGMAVRTFWPAVHQLQTPRYVLWGPLARAELDVPLGKIARLRFGPEAQLFFIAGTDLTDYGVNQTGFALGAEASLELRLTEHFLLELQFRQSNALASSTNDPSFRDVERFFTARWAGEL